MSLTFQRTIESFTCGHCGREVSGNGYTNHCPACLYSRHVDIHPGDRAADCKGLMRPVQLVLEGKTRYILHECLTCGFRRRNKASAEDDSEALIALSAR